MKRKYISVAVLFLVAFGIYLVISIRNALTGGRSDLRRMGMADFQRPTEWRSSWALRDSNCTQVEYKSNALLDTLIFESCEEDKRIAFNFTTDSVVPTLLVVISNGEFHVPLGVSLVHNYFKSDSEVVHESTLERAAAKAMYIHVSGAQARSNSEGTGDIKFFRCRELQYSTDGEHLSFALKFKRQASGRLALRPSSTGVCGEIDFEYD